MARQLSETTTTQTTTSPNSIEIIWSWLSRARHGACHWEWFKYPMRLHWWKLIFPFWGLSVGDSFLVRLGNSCPHHLSGLGFYLAWTYGDYHIWCHHLHEFIDTSVFPFFLEGTVSSISSDSYTLSASSSVWLFWGEVFGGDILFRIGFQRSLTLSTLSNVGICFCLLQEEESLMIAEQLPDLWV